MTRDPWDVARDLAEVVVERDRQSQAAVARYDEAGKASAAAYQHLSEAVDAYRSLVAALVGGAGHDGRHPLPEAQAKAEAVLGRDGGVDRLPFEALR